MRQRPLVLLCAASGTGLSTITTRLAKTLAEGESAIVRDLETKLCEDYEGDTGLVLHPGQVPSMESVVRRPRNELYDAWERHCESLMSEFAAESKADLRVLSLHLTWYDSNTTEFYSPVKISCFNSSECRVDRVVILIDDIYDMYCRLRGTRDLYNDAIMRNKKVLIGNLRGIDLDRPPKDWEQEDIDLTESRLACEALELALGHLMSWRRSEMIYAENLARALGADFTVLGTKHSLTSLRHLTRSLSTPKTYLSHRISEVRRMNKASSSLPEDRGCWSPVVGGSEQAPSGIR